MALRGLGLRRRRRRKQPSKHYLAHKEKAHAFITARLEHWNAHYQFTYNRIAIRNQKTCWGSCSAHGNLNFSYKILFLPPHLADYIIVHELCHLAELNHSPQFWARVAEACPEYKKHRAELKRLTVHSGRVVYLRS